MFVDHSQNSQEIKQVAEWYKYQQEAIENRFKQLHTDALEQIRNKMKRKQTKIENQQNIQRIEKQRSKIIEAMKAHVDQCEHPHCRSVQEIVMVYNLRQIDNTKKDQLSFIVKYGTCTGYVKTDCPVGSKINEKMMDTHRIRKNM